MPLKDIPPVITPQLLRTLASMGQSQEIVVADANFPTTTICESGPIEIRADGVNTVEMLEAILDLLPLEDTSGIMVHLMTRAHVDATKLLEVKQRYLSTCSRMQGSEVKIVDLDKDDFLKRAKQAYAVIHTQENFPCGSLILTKGNINYTSDTNDTKDTNDTTDTKYKSYTDSLDDSGDSIEILVPKCP